MPRNPCSIRGILTYLCYCTFTVHVRRCNPLVICSLPGGYVLNRLLSQASAFQPVYSIVHTLNYGYRNMQIQHTRQLFKSEYADTMTVSFHQVTLTELDLSSQQ